jgi:hypothetical protein
MYTDEEDGDLEKKKKRIIRADQIMGLQRVKRCSDGRV